MVGQVLNAKCQEFVLHLLEYFNKEKENGGPLLNICAVQKRVAEALKICEKTVARIVSRKKMNIPLSDLTRKRQKSKTQDVDEVIKVEIRNIIYDMYARKEHITLLTLLPKIREKQLLLDIGKTSLRLLIKSIGFSFKTDNNRRALCEKSHIVSMRTKFLRQYVSNISSPLPLNFVFLDET